jgi:dTMP kinase
MEKRMKGKFITIEGPDGAGKSTQTENLSEFLREKGYKVIVTREPGGTDISEKVREILLDRNNIEMDFKTEVLLYAASRAQLLAEKIKKYIESGYIVISDRFVDSSIAYQGYGRNIDLEYVKTINYNTIKDCIPDLTILLDLPVEEGLKRIKKENLLDRLESEKIDFHYRVREGFLKIADLEKDRFRVINAADDYDTIYKNVIKAVNNIL